MCRNITMLRGLEPPATQDEITAAALQYVRKVGGVQSVSPATKEAVDEAVAQIAAVTAVLLEQLPARRNPPPIEPPMRRRAASAVAGVAASAVAGVAADGRDGANGADGADGADSAGGRSHAEAHAAGIPHTH